MSILPLTEARLNGRPSLALCAELQDAICITLEDLIVAQKKIAELQEALRNIERATDCPSHKETDLVFVRAGLQLVRSFARAALGKTP